MTLETIAHSLGVSIRYTDLSLVHRDGQYDHYKQIIWLQRGMSARLERSVLAHEVAHAINGDVPSVYRAVNLKQEALADEWAAHHLITLDAYRDAEAAHNGHAGAIAQELNVVTSLVHAFQATLARIGDTVYEAPRMGAGCWAARVPALVSA